LSSVAEMRVGLAPPTTWTSRGATLHTLRLVIRRYETSTYVWGIGAGDQATDSGVEPDMAACLQEAAACFEDKRPVRLSVTYTAPRAAPIRRPSCDSTPPASPSASAR